MAYLGPLFINSWDHNPQNQSQTSFSGYKPCVKIFIDIYMYLLILKLLSGNPLSSDDADTNIRPNFFLTFTIL